VALILAVAAGRLLAASLAPPEADLLDPARGPPTCLPDPARSGWATLTALPGLGPERARRVVRERAALGVPLRPGRLHLLPGIGPGLEERIRAWYARGGWELPDAHGFRTPDPGG